MIGMLKELWQLRWFRILTFVFLAIMAWDAYWIWMISTL